MSNKNRSLTGSIVSVVLSLSILVLSGWVVLNRQFVFDQWSVSRYQPTTEIASIVDRVGFTEEGKFFFYASHPEVISTADFNAKCTRQEAKSAILGCYSVGRIYIYDVPNSQLDGIEEVTAAHEMLHAAWERMSDSERESIGSLLDAEYKKIEDAALLERMAYYDRNEPGEHFNELHSIIGTEMTLIGSDLEEYYAKYFVNRVEVVALHAQYQQVFDSIDVESRALSAELNIMAEEIKTSISGYNAEALAISRESSRLRTQANTLDRTSQAEVDAYNSDREALIARIDQLEAVRAAINEKTELYNAKIAQYESLVVRSNELTQSLDSSLAPAPRL